MEVCSLYAVVLRGGFSNLELASPLHKNSLPSPEGSDFSLASAPSLVDVIAPAGEVEVPQNGKGRGGKGERKGRGKGGKANKGGQPLAILDADTNNKDPADETPPETPQETATTPLTKAKALSKAVFFSCSSSKDLLICVYFLPTLECLFVGYNIYCTKASSHHIH